MARWSVGAVAIGDATLWLGGEAALFPEAAPDPDALLAAVREHDCASGGYWALEPDPDLGARLLARGFGWGWQPHWMACDLASDPGGLPGGDSRFGIEPAAPPFARTLPYAPADGVPDPDDVIRLVVRLREKAIGQIAVNPRDGIAGIYSMGVAPRVRGRGIATALTREACRRAAELGCTHAVLNATDAG